MTKKSVGRPKLDIKRDARAMVNFYPAEYSHLKEISKSRGISISNYLYEIISLSVSLPAQKDS